MIQHCECTQCHWIIHLKTVPTASFMLYIFFYHNKKKSSIMRSQTQRGRNKLTLKETDVLYKLRNCFNSQWGYKYMLPRKRWGAGGVSPQVLSSYSRLWGKIPFLLTLSCPWFPSGYSSGPVSPGLPSSLGSTCCILSQGLHCNLLLFLSRVCGCLSPMLFCPQWGRIAPSPYPQIPGSEWVNKRSAWGWFFLAMRNHNYGGPGSIMFDLGFTNFLNFYFNL